MASVNIDQSSFNAMLKEMYDTLTLQDLTYSSHPLMSLLPKKGGMGGKGSVQPLTISPSAGLAISVAAAQATLAAPDVEAFTITPITLLAVARISGITLESSATSKQAFIVGAKAVVDNAVRRLSNVVSSEIFRDGTGTIGTIGTISTGVVQLTEVPNIVQFELNTALQAYDPATGTLRAGVGYVIAVNRDSGQFTLSNSLGGTAATPSGFAAGDNLVIYSTKGAAISGLQAWLTVGSSSTPFFGVDRSKDKVRLSGIYIDGSSLSVKDALIKAISRVQREGGNPDYIVMDFESYTQLAQDLGSNVLYTTLDAPGAKVSFAGFKFMSSSGEVTVVGDRDCPPKTAFVLQLNTWAVFHANEGSMIFLDENQYGSVLRTVDNFDGVECRAKAYLNLACSAPGFNARVALSA